MGVASCNPVTRRLGDRGDATHECPADAKYVDVHRPGDGPRRETRRRAVKGNNFSLLRRVFRLRYHGPTPAVPRPKDSKSKHQPSRARIAATAARMMTEHALE